MAYSRRYKQIYDQLIFSEAILNNLAQVILFDTRLSLMQNQKQTLNLNNNQVTTQSVRNTNDQNKFSAQQLKRTQKDQNNQQQNNQQQNTTKPSSQQLIKIQLDIKKLKQSYTQIVSKSLIKAQQNKLQKLSDPSHQYYCFSQIQALLRKNELIQIKQKQKLQLKQKSEIQLSLGQQSKKNQISLKQKAQTLLKQKFKQKDQVNKLYLQQIIAQSQRKQLQLKYLRNKLKQKQENQLLLRMKLQQKVPFMEQTITKSIGSHQITIKFYDQQNGVMNVLIIDKQSGKKYEKDYQYKDLNKKIQDLFKNLREFYQKLYFQIERGQGKVTITENGSICFKYLDQHKKVQQILTFNTNLKGETINSVDKKFELFSTKLAFMEQRQRQIQNKSILRFKQIQYKLQQIRREIKNTIQEQVKIKVRQRLKDKSQQEMIEIKQNIDKIIDQKINKQVEAIRYKFIFQAQQTSEKRLITSQMPLTDSIEEDKMDFSQISHNQDSIDWQTINDEQIDNNHSKENILEFLTVNRQQ